MEPKQVGDATTKPEAAAPVASVVEASNTTQPDMTRRRMMVTGLVAATMLVTLRARPVLAGSSHTTTQSGSLGLSYGVYGASTNSTGGTTSTKKKKKH